MPDTGVGSCLHTVQKLRARLRHACRHIPRHLHKLHHIPAYIRDLFFLDINLYSAYCIYHIYQRIKIHRDIMLDIQIQILIQHRNRIFRASVRIRGVRLI